MRKNKNTAPEARQAFTQYKEEIANELTANDATFAYNTRNLVKQGERNLLNKKK